MYLGDFIQKYYECHLLYGYGHISMYVMLVIDQIIRSSDGNFLVAFGIPFSLMMCAANVLKTFI